MVKPKELELMTEMVMFTEERVRSKEYKIRQGNNQLIDAHAILRASL